MRLNRVAVKVTGKGEKTHRTCWPLYSLRGCTKGRGKTWNRNPMGKRIAAQKEKYKGQTKTGVSKFRS